MDIPFVTDREFAKLAKSMATVQRPPAPRLSQASIQTQRRKLVRRLLRLKMEGLKLYEPLPLAAEFHACNALWRLLDGSNRAGKAQPVDEPVLTPSGWRRIGDLSPGDLIIGGDGKACKVLDVFPQGILPVYRVRFNDGAETRCCNEHLWKVLIGARRCSKNSAFYGQYQVLPLSEIRKRYGDLPKAFNRVATPVAQVAFPEQPVPLDPYLLGILLGDGCIKFNAVSFSTSDCFIVNEISKTLPDGCVVKKNKHRKYDYSIVSNRQRGKNPVISALRNLGLIGCGSESKYIPKPYLLNARNVRLDLLRGLLDADGSVTRGSKGYSTKPNSKGAWKYRVNNRGKGIEYTTTSHRLADGIMFLMRSLGGKCTIKWRTTQYTYKGKKLPGKPSARIRLWWPEFQPFRLPRKAKCYTSGSSRTSTRILRSIVPAGKSECVCVSVDNKDHTYITNDFVVTHNTLTGAAEDAYAMTGTHPHKAYPSRGLALFVGLERKHLTLMYLTLFEQGAFKIIKDEHTGLYRSVRWDRNNPTRLQEYDEAYREKWKDAPPLIPQRLIRRIDFDCPDVPRRISLTTGWSSIWQSAAGEPPQGAHFNHAHFDEEMPNPEFYKETHRGLTRISETVQQRPKGIWSATSQVANVELAELRDKAAADPESDFSRQFVFTIDNNPYFSEEARKEFHDGLSEEDRLTRYYGIPASQVRRIYRYNPMGDSENGTGHGCEPFEIDPAVYCRYVILDPAVNHFATLFVAIDPEEKYFTVYDGFEVSGATTTEWANEVKKRQCGVKFESRIIDRRMGKERRLGEELTTVANECAKALDAVGVQFRTPGPFEGFIPGSDDVDARTLTLKSLMDVRSDGPFEGTCKLRIFRGRLPHLDKQIHRAQTDPKNRDKRLKNPKVPQDFLDDLEYGAAANLRYFKPEPEKPPAPKRTVYQRFKEEKRRARQLQAARQRFGRRHTRT